MQFMHNTKKLQNVDKDIRIHKILNHLKMCILSAKLSCFGETSKAFNDNIQSLEVKTHLKL